MAKCPLCNYITPEPWEKISNMDKKDMEHDRNLQLFYHLQQLHSFTDIIRGLMFAAKFIHQNMKREQLNIPERNRMLGYIHNAFDERKSKCRENHYKNPELGWLKSLEEYDKIEKYLEKYL